MQLPPDPMRAKLAPIDSTSESIVHNVRVGGGGVENKYEESNQEEAVQEDVDEEAPVQEEIEEEDAGEEEVAEQ